MAHLVRGDQLSDAAGIDVLAAFGYRWTIENLDRARDWHAAGGVHVPTMAPTTDAEWLASHAFHTTRAGHLDRRYIAAEPAALLDAL